MRLVKIHTLQLEEFEEGSIPPYAALSHRWTSEELNFKEVYKQRTKVSKKGYRKLVAACQKAAEYNVEHLWIDTCCIDKSSSAELSEAINSMFSCYEKSKVCLAYLEDARAGAEFASTFRESVWFRRSWTLQELIAPESVEFFDVNWKYMGSKVSNGPIIEELTGIPGNVLQRLCPLSLYSIAEKMSWACERAATRHEDIAYSLLGIFDVNMPPLYGEGSKAFFRLQQEIIRHANDFTFLLWGRHNVFDNINSRLLAQCPAEFMETKSRVVCSLTTDHPMTVSNVGIEMLVDVVRCSLHIYGIIVASAKDNCPFALLVRKRSCSEAFYRIGVVKLPLLGPHALKTERKLLVLWGHEGELSEEDGLIALGCPKYGFAVETDTPFPIGPIKIDHSFSSISPTERCIAQEVQQHITIDFGDPMNHMAVTMECRIEEHSTVFIQLMFDFDSNPIAHVHNDNNSFDTRQALYSTAYSSHHTDGVKESEITVTTNSRTSRISGVLKSHGPSSNTFARIPRELAINDSELWISFISPTSRSNNSRGWWTFRISTQRPHVLRNSVKPSAHFL